MTEIKRKKQIVRIDGSEERWEYAVIYCMLFSLYRRIIIKKKEPLPARTGSLFHQNTSRRKYPDIMIRIFDLFCKLKDIKISDQEWFDQAVRSLDLSVHPCPYCHSKGHLIPHDVYSRYMVTLKGHRPVTAVLRVPRVKCTSCGHTHALLPEMLIPYSSYSLRFVLTVLEAYFLHAHTVEEICETYQIAHSTLYVFRSLFLSHKRLILGVLDDMQETASGFIGKIDGKQLFQFLDAFQYSFLQAYHASDFHHR